MRKFIAGLAIGLVAAVGGTATAAQLGEWRDIQNDGVLCSVGRPGTSVETSAVCTIAGGKWHMWTISLDKELGIKLTNGGRRTVFGRGALGAAR